MGKKISLSSLNPLGSIADPLGVFGQADSALGLGPKEQKYENTPAPTAPEYESLRNADGTLKDIYKFDPTQSAAFKQIQGQAMSTGPSAWAQLQGQKQGLEEAGLRDAASKQGLQAMNNANAMLARTGGLSSGAARLNAKDSARNMMDAGQNISRQGMLDRLGISSTDEDRRQQLLGQVADTELNSQNQNLSTMMGDVQGKRSFDLDRYTQQMAAWGANNTANAQLKSASQTKKGKK